MRIDRPIGIRTPMSATVDEHHRPLVAAGDQRAKYAGRFLGWTIGLPFAAVVARETIGGRTVLLTVSPTSVQLTAYLAGLALGSCVARRIIQNSTTKYSGLKRYYVSGLVIVLGIVTISYLGRWFYEIASFARVGTETQVSKVKIVGLQGGKSGTFATVRLSPESRDVKIAIRHDLDAKLSAIRPPLWSVRYADVKLCLSLPLQRGRWDTIRAYVPARWDEGLSRIESCDDPTSGQPTHSE